VMVRVGFRHENSPADNSTYPYTTTNCLPPFLTAFSGLYDTAYIVDLDCKTKKNKKNKKQKQKKYKKQKKQKQKKTKKTKTKNC